MLQLCISPKLSPWSLLREAHNNQWVPVLSTDMVSERAKCERLEVIIIDGNLEKFFQVGAQLSPWEKEELLAFLRRNIDVFA